MCGRYTLRTPPAVLVEHFRLGSMPPLSPRFNIAPTQQVGAVRQSTPGQREFVWMRWGLVPHWAKDKSIGNQLINARSESAASKPTFRDSFRRRRCLIAADGFYEWKKIGKQKQPYLIRMPDHGPFAFAGLWDRWGDDADGFQSCTILTTAANATLSDLHQRMPVILDPLQYDQWLDPALSDNEQLHSLLDAALCSQLVVEPVSPRVNNVANDDPGVLAPPPPLLFD
jgi:putative SOS response-associated peptidase YedK